MRALPLLGLILAASASIAATPVERPCVCEIAVDSVGSGSVDRDFVLSQVRTAVGAPLSQTALAADVKSLLATKRFAYVGVLLSEQADGVRVTYVVQKRLRLAERVAVTGAKAIGGQGTGPCRVAGRGPRG